MGFTFWLKQIWVLLFYPYPLLLSDLFKWSLLGFHHAIMVYKASFVFETNEIKFLTMKKGRVRTHIFSCTAEMYCIVGYARLHTQTISFQLSNNMDFIPNNFISMICPIKNEDCEK
jgi:hypothetical protein